jgi:hypothetical protein
MEKEILLSTGEKVKARRAKVKDIKLVQNIKNDIDRETTLIGNLTQKTVEEIDELDMSDYALLQKELLL